MQAMACLKVTNRAGFSRGPWVDWFNHLRLLEPIGYVPPKKYEDRYYAQAAVA